MLIASCGVLHQPPDLLSAPPLQLTNSEILDLTNYVLERARGSNSAAELPASRRRDQAERLVFVTASDLASRGEVYVGQAIGIEAAIDNALSKLAEESTAVTAVQLDVVESVEPASFPIKDASFTAGLFGLIIAPTNTAILPGEIVAGNLLDRKRNLNHGYLLRAPASALRRRLEGLPIPNTQRFTTTSAFADDRGPRLLYRGQPQLGEIEPKDLIASALAGALYLRRALKSDGSFVYAYWPKTDQERRDYNVLRHAGTTYSMFEFVGRTPHDGIEIAARRALAKLRDFIHPCPAPAKGEQCVVDGGTIKLGGNALAILALSKHFETTGEPTHLDLMRSLARYILAVQQPNGEFHPHMQRARDGAPMNQVSIYYPGEALLALLRLHHIDPDGPWLDAAARGARYLIQERDIDLPRADLPHDHWLLYALNELHRAQPSDIVFNHAMEIARAIANGQNSTPEFPDWLGSFYKPPRSTPSSTRVEGLVAAFELARDFGSAEDAAMFKRAIDLGVRHVLHHQFRPASVLFLPNPQRALGGFRRGFTSYEIRIDYVQHAISALLGYERISR